MAVVTINGDAYQDATNADYPIDAGVSRASVLAFVSEAAIASGNSTNSVIYFGRIPAEARICRGPSLLFNDTISGLTDFDVGFANDPDGLIDGANLATTSTHAFGVVTADEINKPAWELAGLTENPGGLLDIIGTLKANAGAAGDVALELYYRV